VLIGSPEQEETFGQIFAPASTLGQPPKT